MENPRGPRVENEIGQFAFPKRIDEHPDTLACGDISLVRFKLLSAGQKPKETARFKLQPS
jgi:hypothetical protein